MPGIFSDAANERQHFYFGEGCRDRARRVLSSGKRRWVALKIFSDSALIAARTCDKMSCDQRSECLRSELGADPTAMP